MFSPGPASEYNLPTYVSSVARFTCRHHHAQFVCRDEVSLTFCLSWSWTLILLISISE
jgi:hypothetical protein